MSTIVIDPVTRIEGHLKIETVMEDGVVKETRSVGNLFRGLEVILKGRDPRDAQVITQRICGVCPQSHAVACSLALDSAFGIAGMIPNNARTIRNLIQGAHMVEDHILHFYHLAALDYVDIKAVEKYSGGDAALRSVRQFIEGAQLGPFMPRYEGDYRLPERISQQACAHYIEALEIRRTGEEMVSIFSGKIPHSVGIVPGGVTCTPTVDMITSFLWKLRKLQQFVNDIYLPDVLAVAGAYADYFEIGAGCQNYLSYGAYDLENGQADVTKRKRLFPQGVTSSELSVQPLDVSKISEEVTHSWYEDSPMPLHPSHGETMPRYGKEDAYSWVKAPRYDSKVYEVGPLARVAVAYAAGNPAIKSLVDSALKELGASPSALFSVMGRHLARAVSAKFIVDNLERWLLEIKPGEPTFVEYRLPDEGAGIGLTEAARGALGHWIEMKDKKISNYQCVVPTTWNASPRDKNGNPGPIEQAITGTRIRDRDNPFEIVRIVRSFDPCLACAIH